MDYSSLGKGNTIGADTMRSISIALWLLTVTIVTYMIAVAFFMLMPTTYWFEYHSVAPVKQEYKVDETLKFVSHLSIYHPSRFRFNDILLRKVGKELERYSQMQTSRDLVYKEEDKYSRWPYVPGPSDPGTYCLDSNIVLRLPFGVERATRFDGCAAGYFFIVEE